jgi:hypothetical protein
VRRFRISRTLVIVGAAVAVFVGGVAFADSTTGSGSSFVDSLARHLGISTEKLQDAAKAAALDQVDQALAAGTITKDQADALKQRINHGHYPLSGQGPAFGLAPGPGLLAPRRGFGFRFGFGFGLRTYASAAASYLGLSEQELLQKLGAGQSLADVAKAQNKSVSGLEDALSGAAKKQLDQAVADKRLTADQAAKVLDRVKAMLDRLVNATLPFRPPSLGVRGRAIAPFPPFAGRGFGAPVLPRFRTPSATHI